MFFRKRPKKQHTPADPLFSLESLLNKSIQVATNYANLFEEFYNDYDQGSCRFFTGTGPLTSHPLTEELSFDLISMSNLLELDIQGYAIRESRLKEGSYLSEKLENYSQRLYYSNPLVDKLSSNHCFEDEKEFSIDLFQLSSDIKELNTLLNYLDQIGVVDLDSLASVRLKLNLDEVLSSLGQSLDVLGYSFKKYKSAWENQRYLQQGSPGKPIAAFEKKLESLKEDYSELKKAAATTRRDSAVYSLAEGKDLCSVTSLIDLAMIVSNASKFCNRMKDLP